MLARNCKELWLILTKDSKVKALLRLIEALAVMMWLKGRPRRCLATSESAEEANSHGLLTQRVIVRFSETILASATSKGSRLKAPRGMSRSLRPCQAQGMTMLAFFKVIISSSLGACSCTLCIQEPRNGSSQPIFDRDAQEYSTAGFCLIEFANREK